MSSVHRGTASVRNVRRHALATLTAIAVVTVAGACSTRVPVAKSFDAAVPERWFDEPEDSTRTPAVVVRDYWRSPTASVVAWSEEQPVYGIRGAIRLDGTLVHDHQFYINVYHFPNWGSFTKLTAWDRQLEREGMLSDVHSCEGDKGCSPYRSFLFRLPDSLLRNSRGGVVLTFVGNGRPDVDIELRGALISSYLDTFDSTAAQRRRRISSQH